LYSCRRQREPRNSRTDQEQLVRPPRIGVSCVKIPRKRSIAEAKRRAVADPDRQLAVVEVSADPGEGAGHPVRDGEGGLAVRGFHVRRSAG